MACSQSASRKSVCAFESLIAVIHCQSFVLNCESSIHHSRAGFSEVNQLMDEWCARAIKVCSTALAGPISTQTVVAHLIDIWLYSFCSFCCRLNLWLIFAAEWIEARSWSKRGRLTMATIVRWSVLHACMRADCWFISIWSSFPISPHLVISLSFAVRRKKKLFRGPAT